jgi:catechol 2,3-dioxygenase-like lactoylglutathione lyase family enzyme
MQSADGRIFPPAGVLRPSDRQIVAVGDGGFPHFEEGTEMPSRVRIALNVSDIDAAVVFYRELFAVEPVGRRAGVAEFEIADPPLRLVVFESRGASSPVHELGVELDMPSDLMDAAARFADAGMSSRMSDVDACCDAPPLRVWVDAPDAPLGAWAFSATRSDESAGGGGCSKGSCCGSASPASPASACCSTVGEV